MIDYDAVMDAGYPLSEDENGYWALALSKYSVPEWYEITDSKVGYCPGLELDWVTGDSHNRELAWRKSDRPNRECLHVHRTEPDGHDLEDSKAVIRSAIEALQNALRQLEDDE